MLFLRTILGDVLLRNEGEDQEWGRLLTYDTGNPTQERGTGIAQEGGERRAQDNSWAVDLNVSQATLDQKGCRLQVCLESGRAPWKKEMCLNALRESFVLSENWGESDGAYIENKQ